MACCKCAGHIFTDHFHTGAAKQILLVALTLGLPTHTAGFTISKWHTYNQTRNKFGQTDRHTYIHTDIQCSSWAGVAFRRHCHGHASPSSTIMNIAIIVFTLAAQSTLLQHTRLFFGLPLLLLIRARVRTKVDREPGLASYNNNYYNIII